MPLPAGQAAPLGAAAAEPMCLLRQTKVLLSEGISFPAQCLARLKIFLPVKTLAPATSVVSRLAFPGKMGRRSFMI